VLGNPVSTPAFRDGYPRLTPSRPDGNTTEDLGYLAGERDMTCAEAAAAEADAAAAALKYVGDVGAGDSGVRYVSRAGGVGDGIGHRALAPKE
jgi:hypothetical protein